MAKPEDFLNTKETTADFSQEDITANKVMAIFSYIGFLFIIPLLAAPNSQFAKYHANQGIVLFIVEVVASIVFGILGIIPIIGIITGIIYGLLGIVFFIFAVLGIINAYNGKAKELPLIGGIKLLK